MPKTPYQQRMDLLGLQEHNLFEIGYSKAVHFTTALSARYANESVLDERSFLLRSIIRMTNLMRSVHVLFTIRPDRAAMLILTRSIIDINATICFLFDFVKDRDERELRLLLFYLDGVRTRLKISDEPRPVRDSDYISEEEYESTMERMEKTKEGDLSAMKDLEKRIQESPLYSTMHPLIFQKAVWKYKKIDSRETYSWIELYEIAGGENKLALFEQEFLSHYVHGVAIADIQYPTINEINPVFALNISCAILNHLDSIIKKWFPNDFDELEESFKQVLVDNLLKMMSKESLEEYIRRIEEEKD